MASWDSILKTKPTIETITAAMAELETDGPRGTIVLGVALIEGVLRDAVLYHMVTLTDKERDQLLGGYAPLSSFSALTKVAYAFRIIGPKTRDDLDRLRRLRNGFAHSQLVLSFETPELIDEISKLNCLSQLHEEGTIRILFRTAVRILMVHLIVKMNPDLQGDEAGDEIRNLG